MGHQMAYPVMAKILNFDSGVYNGNGPGGAQIIGWLPIVSGICLSMN